jgi:hypothetical protein
MNRFNAVKQVGVCQSVLLASASADTGGYRLKRHAPASGVSTALRLLALASTLFCTSHALASSPFTYAAYGYYGIWGSDVVSEENQSVSGSVMVAGAAGQKARASLGDNGVAMPSGGGGYAVSAWSDGFVVTGGSGTASLNLSVQLHGTLIDPQDAHYALLKSDDPNAFSPASIISEGVATTGPAGTTQVLYVEVDDSFDHSDHGATSLPSGFVNQVFNMNVSFTYGQTFYLASVLDIGGHGDFYNSADFGITAPVGAGITSLSGTLYPAAAVPEADTYAMMLAGLSLVGFAARRRAAV